MTFTPVSVCPNVLVITGPNTSIASLIFSGAMGAEGYMNQRSDE